MISTVSLQTGMAALAVWSVLGSMPSVVEGAPASEAVRPVHSIPLRPLVQHESTLSIAETDEPVGEGHYGSKRPAPAADKREPAWLHQEPFRRTVGGLLLIAGGALLLLAAALGLRPASGRTSAQTSRPGQTAAADATKVSEPRRGAA